MLPLTTARLGIVSVLVSVLGALLYIELRGIRWTKLFSTNPADTRWSWYSHTPIQRRWTTLARQFIALILLCLFGAISVPIVFFKTRAEGAAEITGGEATRTQPGPLLPTCDTIGLVDADISGDGIRIAIWTQICFLLAIAVLGTFHCKATGAKELGAGLAVTHFSLAVALVVQYGRGTLSPADAVIGAMILDAQNSALLIQLTTKETLAARWQVGIIAACEVAGLVAVPFLVQGFRRGVLGAARADCEQCLSVFWWAFLRNCPSADAAGVDSDRDMLVFWLYYACRCLCAVQSIFLAAVNIQHFHLAEKDDQPLNGITFPHMAAQWQGPRHGGRGDMETAVPSISPSEQPLRRGRGPRGMETAVPSISPSEWALATPEDHWHDNDELDPGIPQAEPAEGARRRAYNRDLADDGPTASKLRYSAYPSTVTLTYSICGVFALTSMASAEMTMRDSRLRPSSEIFSVGQVTGIVVAGATSVRAAWLFLRMFFGRGRNGRLEFLWPFSSDFLGLLYSPTFIVYPAEGEPGLLLEYSERYGQRPELQLGDVLTVTAQRDVHCSRGAAPGDGIPGIKNSMYLEQISNALVQVPRVGDFLMDELEVRYLFTDASEVRNALLLGADRERQNSLLPGRLIPKKKRKLNKQFVVTGVMLARGLRGPDEDRSAAGQPVLFAYQLQEVRKGFRGEVRMRIVYNEASVAEWSILEGRSTLGGGEAAEMAGAIPSSVE
ncbi:hypothetical protein N658DRAFT_526641 [Parathielavia hyrcaniae]|uniref:Uncharacterized protein n=1 Tax=Parathielavia hyrcaniae TaxID=113614 RepID=A0AAN6PXS6_9PEZI|nr:hypothetical protein N658DRAFT_526641 [Parathielavia hyrcaniae]